MQHIYVPPHELLIGGPPLTQDLPPQDVFIPSSDPDFNFLSPKKKKKFNDERNPNAYDISQDTNHNFFDPNFDSVRMGRGGAVEVPPPSDSPQGSPRPAMPALDDYDRYNSYGGFNQDAQVKPILSSRGTGQRAAALKARNVALNAIGYGHIDDHNNDGNHIHHHHHHDQHFHHHSLGGHKDHDDHYLHMNHGTAASGNSNRGSAPSSMALVTSRKTSNSNSNNSGEKGTGSKALIGGELREGSSKGKGGSSCHQCKSRRALDALLHCSNSEQKKKCRKKFCGQCLRKFYKDDEAAARRVPNWRCPSCRNICCCAACRRRREKGKLEAGGASAAQIAAVDDVGKKKTSKKDKDTTSKKMLQQKEKEKKEKLKLEAKEREENNVHLEQLRQRHRGEEDVFVMGEENNMRSDDEGDSLNVFMASGNEEDLVNSPIMNISNLSFESDQVQQQQPSQQPQQEGFISQPFPPAFNLQQPRMEYVEVPPTNFANSTFVPNQAYEQPQPHKNALPNTADGVYSSFIQPTYQTSYPGAYLYPTYQQENHQVGAMEYDMTNPNMNPYIGNQPFNNMVFENPGQTHHTQRVGTTVAARNVVKTESVTAELPVMTTTPMPLSPEISYHAQAHAPSPSIISNAFPKKRRVDSPQDDSQNINAMLALNMDMNAQSELSHMQVFDGDHPLSNQLPPANQNLNIGEKTWLNTPSPVINVITMGSNVLSSPLGTPFQSELNMGELERVIGRDKFSLSAGAEGDTASGMSTSMSASYNRASFSQHGNDNGRSTFSNVVPKTVFGVLSKDNKGF